jgi:hypothetical protein
MAPSAEVQNTQIEDKGNESWLFEDKPRASRGVPNLNVGTDVPLSFTAFGRVIKPPAVRVVVYVHFLVWQVLPSAA